MSPRDARHAAASGKMDPERSFANVKACNEKMKEELEGLCAVQALLHALTVKGRCHCWETLSTREAGLQPDTCMGGGGRGGDGAQSLSPDSHQSPYWNPSLNAKRLHIDGLEGARCLVPLLWQVFDCPEAEWRTVDNTSFGRGRNTPWM